MSEPSGTPAASAATATQLSPELQAILEQAREQTDYKRGYRLHNNGVRLQLNRIVCENAARAMISQWGEIQAFEASVKKDWNNGRGDLSIRATYKDPETHSLNEHWFEGQSVKELLGRINTANSTLKQQGTPIQIDDIVRDIDLMYKEQEQSYTFGKTSVAPPAGGYAR